jgi:hypothetical protein
VVNRQVLRCAADLTAIASAGEQLLAKSTRDLPVVEHRCVSCRIKETICDGAHASFASQVMEILEVLVIKGLPERSRLQLGYGCQGRLHRETRLIRPNDVVE